MTPEVKGFLLAAVVKILFVFTVINVAVMLIIWQERRQSAFAQDRLGPNRVGPQGLLQSVADGLKNFMKEETFPASADKILFTIAPMMAFIPALLGFAVIPFAAPLPGFDFTLPVLGHFAYVGTIPMVMADIPIGFLFVLAITSLGVYGIVLAGWSSNSKYAFLGGLRASAQMVSYEIAMGMSLIALLILVGNVTLYEVVARQQQSAWFVFPLLIGFFVFVVAAFAETNRLPFDLPETESELVAGYHTEYSSMKFAMFFIAEYSNMITASALMATFFFGGWDIPFTEWDEGSPTVLKSLVTMLVFGLKTWLFLALYIQIRWTLPRFRFDQLMVLGWKFMIPLAIGYIVLVATSVLVLDALNVTFGLQYAAVLFALNLLVAYVLFWVVDRNRIMVGAHERRGRSVV
ncbi:MAG: NADH-quinone oxidoreductase subunit NuoH [Gemmatimonadales bacterium]